MKLYGCRNTRSLRALWALEEAGLEYEYVHVDLLKGEGRGAAFLGVNPGGKVPVLVDGDLTLTESGVIVLYVGEKAPASGLVPAEPRARADTMRWCFFAVGELEQPMWTITKHRFAIPKAHRVPAIEPTARWEFEVAARLVDAALAGRDFIAGGAFTGADILVAHSLAWARSQKLDFPGERLGGYLDRMFARPAAARALARERLSTV